VRQRVRESLICSNYLSVFLSALSCDRNKYPGNEICESRSWTEEHVVVFFIALSHFNMFNAPIHEMSELSADRSLKSTEVFGFESVELKINLVILRTINDQKLLDRNDTTAP